MSFANKKGIALAAGFKLQAEAPLDARQQVDTIQDRDELVTIHAAWEGMSVYVKEQQKSYKYIGSEWKEELTGTMYTHPDKHPANMIIEDETHRFFTDTERTKLDGIEDNANNYTHPGTHAATMITEDETHRFTTDTEKNKWNAKADGNHTHSNYTPKSQKIEASLNPANWVTAGSGFKYTLAVAGATATNNIEVLVKGSATDAEVEAWMGASIVCGTQTDGSITLRGFGEQPSIAIPIEVIVRGDV